MFEDVNLTKWLWGVLVLICMFGGLLGLLHTLRRYGLQKLQKNYKKEGRLQILDSLNIDLRRTLVLVDDGHEEHLILLNPQTETHISSKKKA